MLFYNGHQDIEVNNIEKLKDLNQDEANNLSSGPQDLFFNKLQYINSELRRKEIPTIDVTGLWNWKPGSYDRVKHFIHKHLYLNKKTNGMENLVKRTRERANYLGYVERQFREMEFERANLKRMGVGRDVDVDAFKEVAVDFANNLQDSCDKVYNATGGKVKIKLYIDEVTDRQPQLYYDVELNGLEMQIFQDGNTPIQTIPLNTINIIVNTSLRHQIAGKRAPHINFQGLYGTTEDMYCVKFPYISEYGGSRYGTVCFDKHTDDIITAIRKNDLLSFGFLLMQWAQYYNTNYANPYNQPHLLHLGAPKDYSDEYIATQSKEGIISNLNRVISRQFNMLSENKDSNLDYDSVYDRLNWMAKEYDRIDCRWNDDNSVYILRKGMFNALNEEIWFQYEAIIGEVLNVCESTYEKHKSIDELAGIIKGITGNDSSFWKMIDEYGQEVEGELEYTVISDLSRYFLKKVHYNKKEICGYAYDFLVNFGVLSDLSEEMKDNTEDKISDSEKMMNLMKNWASSSEGGR